MEFLKNLNNTKLVALFSGGALLFIGIVVFVLRLSQPGLTPLYISLSPEDSAAIAARLQAMSIPYKIKEENQQIEVASDRVLALRMTLAQEGLPSSGRAPGYELFDKSDALGTSQFVYNLNLVRALEGELARTISTLSPILSARVHLVLPKKELFSKSASNPSASVVLKLKGAQQLSKSEIAAVTHIVSGAVPELKVDNVTIIDDKGNPLKLSSEGSDFMIGGAIDSATEYKINLESRLTKIIEDLLSRSVGFGKVKANVAANVDFDREVVNYETYDTDGQVVRSQRVSSEVDKESDRHKDVSIANNIPNGSQSQAASDGRERKKSDTVTNYEVSKRVGNKITEQGKVKSLSVAILVDGVYSLDSAGGMVYSERSEAEMEKLKMLAASAIGFDPERGDKIELINLRFVDDMNIVQTEESFVDLIKKDMNSLLQTLIIGVVTLLSIIVIMKSLVRKFIVKEDMQQSEFSQSNLVADLGSVIEGSNSAQDIHDNERPRGFEVVSSTGDRYTSVAKYLNDTVENHLDESVAVIKNWLYK